MTAPAVAVVGAGPAGSTAARLLAERGAAVTVFEAARLPRAKLCGGGLTPKAQRLVPAAVLSTVDRWVDRTELRVRHLPPLRLNVPAAAIAMVERSRFDMALTEQAAAVGAQIRDGEPVRAVAETDDGVELRTDRGAERFDALVAADGEPSHVARWAGLASPARRQALGLEVDLPLTDALLLDTAILTYGVPGGYAWYFPKGDHASVGIGSYRADRHGSLRAELTSFARGLHLDPGGSRVQGHWIPSGLRPGPLATQRVLLAGDAAATVDPFFGEGISYAILSGVVAAQAIGDWAAGSLADLRPYDARLRSVLGPAHRELGWIAGLAEASPLLTLAAVRLVPGVREAAIDVIAGRRAPFRPEGQCEAACLCPACEMGHGGARRSHLDGMPAARHCARRAGGSDASAVSPSDSAAHLLTLPSHQSHVSTRESGKHIIADQHIEVDAMSRFLRRALGSAALLGLLAGAIPMAAAAGEGADYGACVAHHATTERGFSGDHNPGMHRGFADWAGCADD